MNVWHEVGSFYHGVDPDNKITLTKVIYDRPYSLVWVGTSDGIVSSYHFSLAAPYTSFVVDPCSPVQDIQAVSNCIYSLTANGVFCHKRNGLLKSKHLNVTGDIMLIVDNELLLARKNRVNRHDLGTMRETGTFTVDADDQVIITTMKWCSPNLCLGLSDGSFHVVHPMTFDPIDIKSCHPGPIIDMDCRKNVVMTTGYAISRRFGMVPDSIVRVYDAKTKRMLNLLNIASGALYARIHPKHTTRALIIGPKGQLNFLDTKDPTNITILQIPVVSRVTGMDVSDQGDCLVVMEEAGFLHFWSQKNASDLSVPATLDLPTAPGLMSSISWDTPLSAIGMPFYTHELLSSWSQPCVFEVGAAPVPVASPSGGADRSSQRCTRRSSVSIPKFRSEKERLGLLEEADEDVFDNDDSLKQGRVPRLYRLHKIHYSKFGIDDFDFLYYNKTGYSGLETQVVENTFYNAVLQMLRWCCPIYNTTLNIFARKNYENLPVIGELAVLFDMLHKGGGRQCRASNFIRMLSAREDVRELGLLDSLRPLSQQIPVLFNFLINAFVEEEKEILGTSNLLPIVGITTNRKTYGSCGYRDDRKESLLSLHAENGDIHGLTAAISRLTDETRICSKCNREHYMATSSQVLKASSVVFVTLELNKTGNAPIPPIQSFSFVQRADKKSLRISASPKGDYMLKGYIAEIADGDDTHAILIMKIEQQWFLFNDFLVKPLSPEDAMDFSHTWKQPLLLMYEKCDKPSEFDYSGWKKLIDTRLLYDKKYFSGNLDAASRAHVLEVGEGPEYMKDYVCALDAEFVQLRKEVAEFYSDGSKLVLAPQTLSLARVSVIRGCNPRQGVAFIDDFVETQEPIVNYLTLYSGIKPGDLNPSVSPYGLVTQQTATRRLWILMNLDCKFVGHALMNDFRTINLQVPREQIIDTLELFYDKDLSGRRRLSLKFLVWALLGERVQTGNHDSIEDAMAALRLYDKYKELVEKNELRSALKDVYSKAQKYGFKVPYEDN